MRRMDRLLFEAFNFTVTSELTVVDPSSVALSPTHNVTAASTTDDTDTDGSAADGSGTLLGVAIGLLVLACMCWMLKPRPVDVESSWLRRVARAQEPEESPEERQKRIEAALAIQVVTATDADGSLRLGPEDMSLSKPGADDASSLLQVLSSRGSTTQPASLAPTGDEEDPGACCCICLEPYDVGEEVAWNKRQLDRCQHVFHKDCILGWLERHNDCPSCRVPIVVEADKEMEDDSGNNAAFAIVHGLLSRVVKTFKPKARRKSKLEKPEIFRRVTSLGTCQTWERLPSQDSGDDMCCTTRAQMIRRVVSDGLSTPTSSRRKNSSFRLERDIEGDGDDSECDVELGNLQVLRHSVSWKRDILENLEHGDDEDLTEEDEIVFKIL